MAALCVVGLAACTPVPEPSAEPVTSPTHTAAPQETEPEFPQPFRLEEKLLDGGAIEAVRQLLEVADNRPAIKLDITRDQVTLTVLDAELNPVAYRWQDDLINQVASDVQYQEQITFYPAGFPIEDIRRLFEVAALLGTGEDQMLQIMEYRDNAVHMNVTTRTESQTVFFKQDGTAFPRLGTRSALDIRRGFEVLTEGSSRVLSMGFEPTQGYWAEVQISEDVIERRTRMGGLPMFTSQRTETATAEPIEVTDVDPGVLARLQFDYGAGEPCEVGIRNLEDTEITAVEFICDGETHHTTLDGRELDLTDR